MGSFDTSCGLSNLTIHERDAVGFLILNESYKSLRENFEGGTSKYIYANDLFRPAFPPIFGQYDDYGRIGNIRPSTTTKTLEEIFHRPIQTIINCIGEQRNLYYSGGEIAQAYLIEGHSLASYSVSVKDKLISVGFKTISAEPLPLILEFDGFVLSETKNNFWEIINLRNEEVVVSGFYCSDADEILGHFVKATHRYPGFRKEDWLAVEALHAYSGMFFLEEVFTEMSEFILEEDDFFALSPEAKKDDWDLFMSQFEETENDDPTAVFRSAYQSNSSRIGEFITHQMGLDPDFREYLKNYKDHADEFYTVQTVGTIATVVNRMLAPTMVGEQYGNDPASTRLNAITDVILAERIRHREEDDF